ncbi:MAG: tRNA-(ms[2]io[6]A)-hydroxylase [Saprospiraceae bacterium]|nr:tRNA-(ms[2]io[6]A)-hydroxylase [Saprospiraceae bacterium]MCF8250629.1 tRNA-(ms[2]io[6]A)-hydroxylase [Saprospiraceae bacterium]MCF8282404.1 tRNA-(ms[2]io[6]A)-hydroxylase [Bacteroidales bacterium]MCF8312260.1 tRNA-(ms[2]io[6]A)-hydroxylase [Saprospiraceae bacterium]MCF8442817.1 tRNA-(ms[2]io[6]A)-hydroxylase [Saprospiraceae bacterium]
MKLNLDITVPSRPEWVQAVMADFPAFLQDHADCERKASSMAMSFVAKFPDRTEIIPELIAIGIEELEHFQQVYEIMANRGIPLPASMGEDPYVSQLIKRCHSGRLERFLDRLLIASVVETRGAERFRLVSEAQTDPEMHRFYKILWASEAKHGHVFVKMALNYFDEKTVYDRLAWWMEQEGEIIDGLPIRAALH